MVLVFLVVLTSGLQYVVQMVNYGRDLERVRQAVRDARLAAWGPKMAPLEGKRKVGTDPESAAIFKNAIAGQSEPGRWTKGRQRGQYCGGEDD